MIYEDFSREIPLFSPRFPNESEKEKSIAKKAPYEINRASPKEKLCVFFCYAFSEQKGIHGLISTEGSSPNMPRKNALTFAKNPFLTVIATVRSIRSPVPSF